MATALRPLAPRRDRPPPRRRRPARPPARGGQAPLREPDHRQPDPGHAQARASEHVVGVHRREVVARGSRHRVWSACRPGRPRGPGAPARARPAPRTARPDRGAWPRRRPARSGPGRRGGWRAPSTPDITTSTCHPASVGSTDHTPRLPSTVSAPVAATAAAVRSAPPARRDGQDAVRVGAPALRRGAPSPADVPQRGDAGQRDLLGGDDLGRVPRPSLGTTPRRPAGAARRGRSGRRASSRRPR